jgi:hypothetical protein
LAAYENGVAGVVSTCPEPSASVAAGGGGTVVSTVDDLVEDWFANPGNPDVQAEVDGEDWVALLQDFDGVMGADEVSATTDGQFHQLSPLQIGSTTDESTTGSSTTDVAMVPAVGVESATDSSTTDTATVPAVGMGSISSSSTVNMATGTKSATGTQLMESVGVATDEVPVRSVGVGDRYVDDDDVVRGYNGPLRVPGRVTFEALGRLLRQHPSEHPDVMARHLTRSSYFGRQLSGQEHELVEFALRAMAAMERVVASDLYDVYRWSTVVSDANYARESFTTFYSGLTMRAREDSNGQSLYGDVLTAQRVNEQCKASGQEQPYESNVVHISDGDN